MPTLSWRGKGPVERGPGRLRQDSIIFPSGRGYPQAQPTSRLILGDNLHVMSALAPEYAGRIDLIYADPPFFTNREYRARIGRGEDSRKPQEWALAEGYGDRWADLDAYLEFLYGRLLMMHTLLAPHGTLYLHLDWHVNSYARLLLDEIFGSEHLLNEIIWTYHGPSPIRKAFNRKHDMILAYVKSDRYTFNADAVRQPYNPMTVQTFKASPKAGFGKVPDLERGKVPEDWWYFPVVARLHKERTGYPTQKPVALLERIVRASSNPGDLLADFFCGSGTAAVAAARLARRFIACDNVYRAVHTTRRRLCSMDAEPFSIEREESANEPRAWSDAPDIIREGRFVRLGDTQELDYWEVDPEWDGRLFRSAGQLLRPGDGEAIGPVMETAAGRKVCVRLVSAQGEFSERELDVQPVPDAPDGL